MRINPITICTAALVECGDVSPLSKRRRVAALPNGSIPELIAEKVGRVILNAPFCADRNHERGGLGIIRPTLQQLRSRAVLSLHSTL